MDSVKVGQSIALLRKKYGMTQLDLAEHLSVTDKAVSRWERGLGMPDTSLLVKLSLILDIDVETLLEGNVSTEDLGWEGVLFLDYPDGILPTDLVYTKRIVYLQLCYFVLAGINRIHILGDGDQIDRGRCQLGNLGSIHLEYDVVSAYEHIKKKTDSGLMVLSGLDIVYGKDFTKCLRRVMNNCRKTTRIHTFEQKPTSISFIPRGGYNSNVEDKYCLERGVFVLSVDSRKDLTEAGNFFHLIEVYQNEPFMDLQQIIEKRHIKL